MKFGGGKVSKGPAMGPKSASKKVGGIRTNFVQGIAPPKLGGKK